ncbi:MAG: hypothetical protein QNJ29_10315 [Rhizobiaceae bacterium]|nr:hypothetical protein [Rhizobiaceae bacterium]
MKCLKWAASIMMLCLLTQNSLAEFLGDEWITETEMKQQSAFARKHSLLLVGLRCKFRENIESPGRGDVLFSADFEQVFPAQAWGWTFDANTELAGPEQQAKSAGFEVATEDYFEISGVTWVRCKVWHRP